MFSFAALSLALAVGVMATGCANQPSSQEQSDGAGSDQSEMPSMSHDDHAGHDHEGGDETGLAKDTAGETQQGGPNQYEEALAKLSADDRALAKKQEVCPVSGKPLGSMGTPYKVTVQDQDILLCCPGCESTVKEDPEKYLAKLSP
jgi:hypothetical protein